jgi:hypothetical protein
VLFHCPFDATYAVHDDHVRIPSIDIGIVQHFLLEPAAEALRQEDEGVLAQVLQNLFAVI